VERGEFEKGKDRFVCAYGNGNLTMARHGISRELYTMNIEAVINKGQFNLDALVGVW
jgi:hypothetical protein